MKLTTTNLRLPSPRAWYELSTPVCAALCIFLLLLLGLVVGRVRSAQTVAAVPTPALPAPIIIIASPIPGGPRPTPAPTAAAQVAAVPLGNVTLRAIVVYGDHDLATAIGAVEAGRAFAPVARWGAEWVQVDMSGNTGRVFVRTSDLYGVPELVDLKPAPAPVVIERPIYVAAPAQAAQEAAPTVSEPLPTVAPQTAAILDRAGWAVAAATARAGR